MVARRDQRHPRRRRWLIVLLILIVAGGVAGVAQYRYDALRDAGRRIGLLPSPTPGPAEVAPPKGRRIGR